MTRCGLVEVNGTEEIGQAVASGLAQATCDPCICRPEAGCNFCRCDLVIAYGPTSSLHSTITRLQTIASLPPLVVWFTEQVPNPSWPRLLTRAAARVRYRLEAHRPDIWHRRLGRLRALGEMIHLWELGLLRLVCVFTDTNYWFMKLQGLPVVCVPMGYHQLWGELRNLERDIDVLFLGSTRDRRRHDLVRRLEEELASRGVTMVVRDGTQERPAVFGNDRTVLLNRSKIMLNIMRQPWDDPVFRYLLSAPNGAMLLSEAVLPGSTGPLETDKHFVMTDLADMPDTVELYLANSMERNRIAASAHRNATEELTMGNMVRELLRAADHCRLSQDLKSRST